MPQLEKRQGRPAAKGFTKARFNPLDLKSARMNRRAIFYLYKNPESRVKALTALLSKAANVNSPNEGVLKLIENARAMELTKAMKSRAEHAKFVFKNTFEGRHLRAMDGNIWVHYNARKFGQLRRCIADAGTFARKYDCREYAAQFLEGVARKMKRESEKTLPDPILNQTLELFFETIGKATGLYREAGKQRRARELERYSARMGRIHKNH